MKYEILKDKATIDLRRQHKDFMNEIDSILKPVIKNDTQTKRRKTTGIPFINRKHYYDSTNFTALVLKTREDYSVITERKHISNSTLEFYKEGCLRKLRSVCKNYYEKSYNIISLFKREVKEDSGVEFHNYQLIELLDFKEVFTKGFLYDLDWLADDTEKNYHYESLMKSKLEVLIEEETKLFSNQMKKDEEKILTIEEAKSLAISKDCKSLSELKKKIIVSLTHYIYIKYSYRRSYGSLYYEVKNYIELNYKFLIKEGIFTDLEELYTCVYEGLTNFEIEIVNKANKKY